MNLENILLNEISRTQKDKYCMISLICGTYKIKYTGAESRKVGEMGRCWSKGTKLLLRRLTMSRDLMGSMVSIVNTAELNPGNVLREWISGTLITHTHTHTHTHKW